MNTVDVPVVVTSDVVGDDDAIYPVITLPPLEEGADHVMVADVLLALTDAVPMVGASATVYRVTELDHSE